jgi:predicted alpha/beta superfamily hydrolase
MYDGAEGTTPASGPVAGNVRVLHGVLSPELANVRDVHVYLPPSYARSGRHYPVLYMHDGQNLFDATTSFAGEWRVDDTLERIADEGFEPIVVAVPNMGPERQEEYTPYVDDRRGGGRGEAYLDFLVNTLKPQIDVRFRTRRERTQTGIMGSSLGGLISLYAFFRHPGVFGFAGVMSPSLWWGDRAIFPMVERAPRWSGRLYLDIGTGEGRAHVRDARLMARLLRRTTERPRRNLLYVEGRGAQHNEEAWADRFERAIRFLYPTPPSDLHW